jgi:hypothetical protein
MAMGVCIAACDAHSPKSPVPQSPTAQRESSIRPALRASRRTLPPIVRRISWGKSGLLTGLIGRVPAHGITPAIGAFLVLKRTDPPGRRFILSDPYPTSRGGHCWITYVDSGRVVGSYDFAEDSGTLTECEDASDPWPRLLVGQESDAPWHTTVVRGLAPRATTAVRLKLADGRIYLLTRLGPVARWLSLKRFFAVELPAAARFPVRQATALRNGRVIARATIPPT